MQRSAPSPRRNQIFGNSDYERLAKSDAAAEAVKAATERASEAMGENKRLILESSQRILPMETARQMASESHHEQGS